MSSERFLGGLVLGGLLGAAVALLSAPRSGEETRTWLKSQAEEHTSHLGEEFNEQMDELRSRIDDVKAKAIQKAHEAAAKFEEATRDVTREANDLKNKVQEKVAPMAKNIANNLENSPN